MTIVIIHTQNREEFNECYRPARDDNNVFVAALNTCLDGKDYLIGQRNPPAHACWMSTYNYRPVNRDVVIFPIDDLCTAAECLGGLQYSTDINSDGPFFSSVTGICKSPSQMTTRFQTMHIAEEDPTRPTCRPTAAFEQRQIMSKNRLCWTGTQLSYHSLSEDNI